MTVVVVLRQILLSDLSSPRRPSSLVVGVVHHFGGRFIVLINFDDQIDVVPSRTRGPSASPLRGNGHRSKGMAPTLCSRCGDAVEEICDPRDELAELDALLERIILKRCDLKRKINRLHSPIVRQLPPDVTSTIFDFCLPDFADLEIGRAHV